MAIVVRRQQTDFRNITLEKLTEKVKESAAWLKDYLTAIRHGQLHPFTPMERKAREATRNEPWGPTGTMLNDLAKQSFDQTNCEIIFAVLQLRMGYPPEKWRNVYKALTVLEFLVKRGSDRCVAIAKDDMLFRIQDLENFQFTGADGRDQGINVRHRAQAIRLLLNDQQQLERERAAFKAKRKQYQGFSRDQLSSQGSGRMGDDHPQLWLRRSRSFDGDVATPPSSSTFQPEDSPAELPPYSRGKKAGEMKGVTLEENRKHVDALRQLLLRPENRACADCTGGGAGSRPTWASINTGVFICMHCAGIHRGLGVHISKVRSVTLDTWLPDQVAFMERTGNAVANSFWEAKLGDTRKPHHDAPELQAFIRRKYNREFAEGEWPPSGSLASATPQPVQPIRRSASVDEVRAASGVDAAGSFWQTPVPSAASTGEGFGFATFAKSADTVANGEKGDNGNQVHGGRRPLRPGTKQVTRILPKTQSPPAGPTSAVESSPPVEVTVASEGVQGGSAVSGAADLRNSSPAMTKAALVAPQPRNTGGLPTGFEELLASVGVSLLDEDYGIPVPSTPYQAPSQPLPLPGKTMSVQLASSSGQVDDVVGYPRSSAYPSQRAYGLEPMWVERSAAQHPVSSDLAFEQDASWSGHSSQSSTVHPAAQPAGTSPWLMDHRGAVASAAATPSQQGTASMARGLSLAGWQGRVGPPAPTVAPASQDNQPSLDVPADEMGFQAPTTSGRHNQWPELSPPGHAASCTVPSNPVSEPLQSWMVPYSLSTPSSTGHVPAPTNLLGVDYGSSPLVGPGPWASVGAVSRQTATDTSGIPSFSRKSAGIPARNEHEARAAKEKEVLDELFTSALEELRLDIPMHTKRRTASLKEQRAV